MLNRNFLETRDLNANHRHMRVCSDEPGKTFLTTPILAKLSSSEFLIVFLGHTLLLLLIPLKLYVSYQHRREIIQSMQLPKILIHSLIHWLSRWLSIKKRHFVDIKKPKKKKKKRKLQMNTLRTCAASNRSRDSSINAQRGNLPPPFAWQSNIHMSALLSFKSRGGEQRQVVIRGLRVYKYRAHRHRLSNWLPYVSFSGVKIEVPLKWWYLLDSPGDERRFDPVIELPGAAR